MGCSDQTKWKPILKKIGKVLISPFVILYHYLRIYFFPCIGVIFLRLIVKVSCCLCQAFCLNRVLYEDDEFPHNDTSIGAEWFQSHPDRKCIWVRASDLMEYKGHDTVCLFSDKIEPKDISQGELGDCWLMSALACMAEFPGLIRQVFVSGELNFRGKYTVRIYNAGENIWHNITVDDFVPVDPNTKSCLFGQPNGNELWVLILEKAFAKFLGSYAKLSGGTEVWAWAALTGGKVYGFKLKSNNWEKLMYRFKKEDFIQKKLYSVRGGQTETYPKNQFWQILLLYDFRDSIISASISHDGEQKRNDGLVEGHAYSLLSVKEIDDIKLIQLRNPWGEFEWTGDWSDKSEMWNKYPHVKTALEFSDANDGSFWISYEDFCEKFNSICVCDRSVGISDLSLDRREDSGFWGIAKGCFTGTLKYFCLCEGCRFLYCGHDGSEETPKLGRCCAPWMFVHEPTQKLKSWWNARKTLSNDVNAYSKLDVV
eukprot:c19977_g1_i1.p1 GENE.c19977_g1_i1~~c19977_g1_i1.p1  ORF type:complete len:483 (-),score=135.09 c19977_g1_i1:153-1601(-)